MDYPQKRARGKWLTRLGEVVGCYRKWYEIPLILDFLYRKRILKAMRGE
jgi:hypothetical protein